MCGIAGRFNFKTRRPVDPQLVERMCDSLAHRGPDGSGVACHGAMGLGHRRLAIIDLSPAGAQPMSTPDGQLWITFNGEIYNYRDLRRELEGRGYCFRSHSDTEVLLHLYREHGAACLEHLRGMFAFAIWDARTGEFFAARDRVGKKPFLYHLDDDGLAFASEAKAFLADPAFSPEPDLAGIWQYLAYQYVPAPASGFRHVSKLPPATYLTIKNGHVSMTRYWKLSFARQRAWTDAAAVEALTSELETATKIRLIADVPLGAFLSGGIDSSLTVALMARSGASPVRTFSIGFEEQQYNELDFARQVADRYQTDHHEFVVRPDVADLLPKLTWHYDEPYADSSAIPTFYLARETRAHVTVALAGDGGDEDFAGYDRFLAHQLTQPLDYLPVGMRRGLAKLAGHLPSGSQKSATDRLRRLLEAVGETSERRYARWVTHLPPALQADLCTPELARSANLDPADLILRAYAATDATDSLNATLDVDVTTYLPNDLLVKADIASMAHGLEVRSPFLDHHVMELAATFPRSLKIRGLTKKFVLKQAAWPLLPRAVVTRPKMGFGVPIEAWLRTSLRALAGDVLLSTRAGQRGYFHMDRVRTMLDDHLAGRRNWHGPLWTLLMLELWHRMFVDQRPATPAPPMTPSPAWTATR